jgi:hypothetical protein
MLNITWDATHDVTQQLIGVIDLERRIDEPYHDNENVNNMIYVCKDDNCGCGDYECGGWGGVESWNQYDIGGTIYSYYCADDCFGLSAQDEFEFEDYFSIIPAVEALEGVAYPTGTCSAHNSTEEHLFPQGNHHIARTHRLTDQKSDLMTFIDDTETWWGTCICCGILKGKEMLEDSTLLNTSQVLVVMSDGVPTTECPKLGSIPDMDGDGDVDARDHAINASCVAQQEGITVNTICFGEDCDNETMINIAEIDCGHPGSYYEANVTNLAEIYETIAFDSLNASYISQSITSTDVQDLLIYPDSYINITFDEENPIIPQFGWIEVDVQTPKFNNCTDSFIIPDVDQFPAISEANFLSYSGSQWTSELIIGNANVFNLTQFGEDFQRLGDPFLIGIQGSQLIRGNNSFHLKNSNKPYNYTSCSKENSMIYKTFIESSFDGEIGNYSEGCNWTIEFENGDIEFMEFPQTFSGTKLCNFTSVNVNYDRNDSVDLSIYELLDNFDFDNNNKSNIYFDKDDIIVDTRLYSSLPGMWGPAIMEVQVWN